MRLKIIDQLIRTGMLKSQFLKCNKVLFLILPKEEQASKHHNRTPITGTERDVRGPGDCARRRHLRGGRAQLLLQGRRTGTELSTVSTVRN